MPADNCIAAIVIDHSATSADMEDVFDFFGLPRETRDAIHEFALLPDKPKVLELQVDPYRQQKRFKHPYINILKKPNINWMLANKQVCAEYQSVVKKYTTVHLTTNGSWDMAKIGEWLPRGVTLGLLQQLQTWTITLDWVHWNRFVNAHLDGPGDPSDPERYKFRNDGCLPKSQNRCQLADSLGQKLCRNYCAISEARSAA